MFRQTDAQDHVDSLISAAMVAVDPFQAVIDAVSIGSDSLSTQDHEIKFGTGQVIVISIGKAAIPMANGLLQGLGGRPSSGVVVTKKGQLGELDAEGFETFYAGHPITDQTSLDGAQRILEVLDGAREEDTVVFLISGGASALVSKPIMNLVDWQNLSRTLLGSGCSISEFNIVRKQLDEVKGGGLANAACPAKFLTLILSDVVGDSLDIVASGPTVPSLHSPKDAADILVKYEIEIPAELTELIAAGYLPSSFDSPVVSVGNLEIAAEACLAQAAELGFQAEIRKPWLEGDARLVGESVADLASGLSPGSCLILGGETTVSLAGSGTGGRNQELGLAAALAIEGHELVTVATFATDGEDGPTDAAGVVVTGTTISQGAQIGLVASEYLEDNDSYSFFSQLDRHLIKTGPTGTNVNDLLFILKYES